MSEGEKIVVCMLCMTVNAETDNFCKNCRAGIRESSALRPAQPERREKIPVLGRPRFINLLGGWLLYVPLMTGTILSAIELIKDWGDFGSYVLFIAGIAISLVAGKILYDHTRDYLHARAEYQAKHRRQSIQAGNRLPANPGRRAKMLKKAR